MKKIKQKDNVISLNKKASHDYFLEQTFEAGLSLNGWEVKSLRSKKINLIDSYVVLKNGEAFLIGCHISPLQTISTHIVADPLRTRKLLLHKKEISKLIGYKEKKGYTIIVNRVYWKNHLIKCSVNLAKGKKEFDKRHSLKEKDTNRDILKAYRKETKRNFTNKE